MKHRSAYCTVDAVLRQLATADKSEYNTSTQIDDIRTTEYSNKLTYIKDLIYDQSERIFDVCQQTFIPYRDTYSIQAAQARSRMSRYSGYYEFHLDGALDGLLSIESFDWIDTTLTSTQYRVGDGILYPASLVQIDTQANIVYSSTFTDTVDLVGVWGYHNNPSIMWVDSGDTPDASVTSAATSFDVSDGDNFEVFQYIKIDDEYLFITNISTNTLTVERGVNGTVAAAHADDDTIYKLKPNDLAESAVRRRVAWLVNNPGEQRTIAPLPDGTITLADGDSIPLPPKRLIAGSI